MGGAKTHANSNRSSNAIAIAIVLVAFVIPITLLWQKIIPIEWRAAVPIGFSVISIGYIIYRKLGWKELGMSFEIKNFSHATMPYFAFSLIACLLLVIFHHFDLLPKKPALPQELKTHLGRWWFYASYIFLTAPAQKFFYTSAFFAELKKRNVPIVFVIVLSGLNFAWGHVFYNSIPILVITFCAGICWGILYHRYPNFWLASLSHGAVGLCAILTKLI